MCRWSVLSFCLCVHVCVHRGVLMCVCTEVCLCVCAQRCAYVCVCTLVWVCCIPMYTCRGVCAWSCARVYDAQGACMYVPCTHVCACMFYLQCAHTCANPAHYFLLKVGGLSIFFSPVCFLSLKALCFDVLQSRLLSPCLQQTL